VFDSIAPHLGPIGQFLVGLTAFLGLAATGWKAIRSAKREIIEATSACMQRIIAASLKREAQRHQPHEFYTLDVEFEQGHRMAVPMFPGIRMLVSENIEMAVLDHTKEQTELGLWCDGYGTLPKHRHSENCERIVIERGTVTHLESGTVYRAGETWVIKPGEWHSAFFHDCYCRVIHRPPLLTAAVRPVNLDAMPAVFPET